MEFFEVGTGVRQGSILSPFLFAMVMDFMLKRALDRPDFGITWRNQCLTDLDFADDIALLTKDINMLQQMTTSLGTKGSNIGLRISGEKSQDHAHRSESANKTCHCGIVPVRRGRCLSVPGKQHCH